VTFIEVHRRRLNAAFGLRWPARSAAQPLLPPVEGLRHGATMQVIATGGKAIYGAPLGILMLEAKFPRIPGDMGNTGTWPFPVLCRVVRGATPERVVLNAATGLLDDFLAAAELVRDGAEGSPPTATSCRYSRRNWQPMCECRSPSAR
jgi:hypothetical protein